jgi:type II secretory pathway component GspD/PulD (secretin)
LAAALWSIGMACPGSLAQTTQSGDAFQEDSAAPEQTLIERPPAVPPQRSQSDTQNQTWQPNSNSTQGDGQLQWGKSTVPAEAPLDAEALPAPAVEGRLPLAGSAPGDDVQLSRNPNGLITLIVRDASLSRVLAILGGEFGLNIVASNDIDALISITLRDVPLDEALTAILSVANYTWVQRNNIILVTSLNEPSLPADVQGRQIQVFDLDFASAATVAEAVTGFLSPIGRVTISESDPVDNRRTRELVVVEDVPESLARIAAYIEQIDCPPRQVLIEAHILQVTLTDNIRCGVDFHALCRIAGSDVNIFSVPSLAHPLPGFGTVNPSAPAFVATFASHDLQAVIELLQTSTDTKTLGSPKILVLNEQEAFVHVGDSIGYQTSTTTDVSITQAPQFLEVGVRLNLTPRITRDGRVLLRVKPEVSSGQFNPESNAPDKRTTELETDVMLNDGQGMVIGGLIRESDEVLQTKVPYLGDVKGLGWFFKKSEVNKQRVEIIFALVPRIQPYDPEYQAFEQGELVKAGVPLMEGPLCRTNRPWDPILPDGKRVYRPLIPKHYRPINRDSLPGSEYIVPPYPLPQQRFYDPACDPAAQGPAGSELHRAFTLDEEAPGPSNRGDAPHGPTVISDQN